MLSSNLNLNIVKTAGYNIRMLISNLGIIPSLTIKKIACDTTRTQ